MRDSRLFYGTWPSVTGTLSCASCHNIASGGDDDRAGSLGVGGQVKPISSPTTLNSDLTCVQFWDGRAAPSKRRLPSRSRIRWRLGINGP